MSAVGKVLSEETAARLQEESIDYFVSLVQMFGLQKSIGQIYGLLFISTEPMPMDEVVAKLQISKGSVSQGLNLLRSLGAVTVVEVSGDRRDHYLADLQVSRIANHFFENRLAERLENGEARLKRMLQIARDAADEQESDPKETEFLVDRLEALQKWQNRGRRLIPLILSWLKR